MALLDALQVDAQLGLISVGDVEASFARCLAAFNDAQLPDDEALQQDNTSTSAMRVKRSVDCLLSTPTATGEPSRVKLRSAGPASAVAWMLRGNAGETHFVVLAHTSDDGEMNGACCGTCLWKRIVWRSHKVKSPHVNTDLRSGVDSHEATCERHGANAGRHVAD